MMVFYFLQKAYSSIWELTHHLNMHLGVTFHKTKYPFLTVYVILSENVCDRTSQLGFLQWSLMMMNQQNQNLHNEKSKVIRGPCIPGLEWDILSLDFLVNKWLTLRTLQDLICYVCKMHRDHLLRDLEIVYT